MFVVYARRAEGLGGVKGMQSLKGKKRERDGGRNDESSRAEQGRGVRGAEQRVGSEQRYEGRKVDGDGDDEDDEVELFSGGR